MSNSHCRVTTAEEWNKDRRAEFLRLGKIQEVENSVVERGLDYFFGISSAPVRLATRSTWWLRHQDSSSCTSRSQALGSA